MTNFPCSALYSLSTCQESGIVCNIFLLLSLLTLIVSHCQHPVGKLTQGMVSCGSSIGKSPMHPF